MIKAEQLDEAYRTLRSLRETRRKIEAIETNAFKEAEHLAYAVFAENELSSLARQSTVEVALSDAEIPALKAAVLNILRSRIESQTRRLVEMGVTDF